MKKYTKRIVIIFSIVVISFVIFFAGVTVGIYHMNNEMTKLHSVMSATSTLDVLSSLRKNQVHNAIELLEDQLDMDIFSYSIVLQEPDFYLDSVLAFIVSDVVPDDIYKSSMMRVLKYRDIYPSEEMEKETRQIIMKSIKNN